MDRSPAELARRSLGDGAPFALVAVDSALGSTPREAGAVMIVTEQTTAGTIGGGRLEWDAIASARDMLRDSSKMRANPVFFLEIPLGPEIGQCCGGRVRLAIRQGDAAVVAELEGAERATIAAQPTVIVYGAGHVGRALAQALAPLPLRVILADIRAEELALVDDRRIERLLATSLTDIAAGAPPGAAHAVMTHSHALDSLIAAAVLEGGRHGYLGLIGSRTKKALFLKGFRELGIAPEALAAIACPIGGATVRDKRPSVIAALAAAEIVTALLGGKDG
jgi:xanthine dehydrogenase accessory protein XdhC